MIAVFALKLVVLASPETKMLVEVELVVVPVVAVKDWRVVEDSTKS